MLTKSERLDYVMIFALFGSTFGGWLPANFVVNAFDPNSQEDKRKSAEYENALDRYKAEHDAYVVQLDNLDDRITVYRTRTGKRYHKSYHYSGRNYSIGLGSAIRSGLTACGTCRPVHKEIPHSPDIPSKPKLLGRTLAGEWGFFFCWGSLIAATLFVWEMSVESKQ